jgi:cyanophycinase
MADRKTVFLLGGGSTMLDAAASPFIEAAGGRGALPVLLLAGGAGWEAHLPAYVQPWMREGIRRYHVIVPSKGGVLDLEETSARLREATGIMIGGGPTPVYQHLYATEPVRSLIRQRYEQGAPVAGISAGAPIVPDICAIPPEDTGEAVVRIAGGLGLIRNLIVGVHFTEWNALPHVVEAMAETRTPAGLGIDEPGCAVFEEGRLVRILGGPVYRIALQDAERRQFECAKVHLDEGKR